MKRAIFSVGTAMISSRDENGHPAPVGHFDLP